MDEWEEPHEARAFDRGFDGALLLGGESALAAAHDAAVRIDELLQKVDVFVVDVLNVILCENVVRHTYIHLKRNIVGINVVFRVLDTCSTT